MNQLSGFLHREKDGLLIVQRNIWIKFKRDFFQTLCRQPTLNTEYTPPTQAGPETDNSGGKGGVNIEIFLGHNKTAKSVSTPHQF